MIVGAHGVPLFHAMGSGVLPMAVCSQSLFPQPVYDLITLLGCLRVGPRRIPALISADCTKCRERL